MNMRRCMGYMVGVVLVAGVTGVGAWGQEAAPGGAEEAAGSCCESESHSAAVCEEATATTPRPVADGKAVAKLVSDLKSADSSRFDGAVKRMPTMRWGHAVDRTIVEMLLTDGGGGAELTAARQVALIGALGKCDQGCATAVLRKKAMDKNPEIRSAAQKALATQARAARMKAAAGAGAKGPEEGHP